MLLIDQEQVRDGLAHANREPGGPIALTCCAALTPRRWRTGAPSRSVTSPLGRKVALVMYFGLWGVASCWKAWSLLAPLEEKRAKAAMGAGRVSVPLSGPRQSDARTAAADDAPSPSRRCATPGSPSTPVLGAAGGQVLGAFDGDPLQTGISARKPPPPRRSYAAGSRRSAWFGGRYGQWAS